VALTANRVSPQPPGTTITWTATATGGVAPLAYRWHVHDGQSWSAVTGWVASATFAWTPGANATYRIAVEARSAGALTPEGEAGAMFVIAPSVTSVTLSPNRVSPQRVGTTIMWTATPAGGVAPIAYRWYVYNGSRWTAVTSWTTSNTFAWTPTAANSGYRVEVEARSAGATFPQAGTIASFSITP
jgi:cell wall-associated protease